MSKISPGVLSPPREVLTPDEWRARGRARRERAWDLGHMATPDLRVSLALAARGNGLKVGAGYAAARRCASSQPAEMARFASMRFLNVRCSRIDARESVVAPFAGPSEYERHGERVAGGQRVIQAATDEFPGRTRGAGTTRAAGNDYHALVDAVATGRIQAVTGLLTANQRPRLTGPLLPCARARPGTASGACHR